VEQEDVMSKLTSAVASFVVLGIVGVAGSVNATTMRHTNYITFSGPVALPGVTLSAGTYTFEVLLDPASETLVRVKSRDGRQVYLAAFTRSIRRPLPGHSRPAIVFGEAERGTPTPVRIWFPAGSPIGHEFIY
jgi:hypothetical protein